MSEANTNAFAEFSSSTEGDMVIAAVAGRLDAVRVPTIAPEATGLPDNGATKMVLDLSRLDWIDSSGVGMLVTIYKKVKANGGRVNVAFLQRQPTEIFRLLRLEAAFKVFETLQEAVEDLRNG